MNITFFQVLKETAQRLAATSDSARFEAELLLSYVMQKERSYFYTWPDKFIAKSHQQHFEQLIQQRLHGQPIAYIVGKQAFWSLDLKVTEDTLIPRPETELLIETALNYYHPHDTLNILDLGTGSGAIALAIASEFTHSQIIAVDLSSKALQVAKDNAAQHQLDNVQFLQSDWFANIPAQKFDLILSNPPYIEVDDPHLNQGDVRYEPRLALHSGIDGFNDIRHIIQQSQRYLKSRGWLMFEHGYQQAKIARQYLAQARFENIQSLPDLAGHERISIASLTLPYG